MPGSRWAVLLATLLAATPRFAAGAISLTPQASARGMDEAPAIDCSFTDVAAGLTAVIHSSVEWGDYDNDGDLDFLLTGSGGGGITKLYRNSGGANPTFSDVGAGLIGVAGGSATWGDYDNDGDLDILLTGASSGVRQAKLYRNSGGTNPTFSDVGAGLTPVVGSSVEWGDYDNDGDLDILLTGDAGTPITKLYRNSGGANPTFAEVGAGFPGVAYASVAWGDYDSDGDLDILLTGSTTLTPTPSISRVYRNNGGANPTFTDIGAGLTGIFSSSVAWGDYDNDGDLDILLAGYNDSSVSMTRLYRNSGGANPTFSDAGAGLSGVGECSLAWGDDDNDGDLDILLTGWDGTGSISKLYRNNGGANPTFSDVGAGLPGTDTSSVAWGDYDNDGDLDFLLAGSNAGTKLYRSSACGPNTPPTAPSGLTVSYIPNGRIFSWNAATDAQTPAAGLTYNLRVGTTPGGNEILSGMAAASGLRKVVRLGNVNHRLQWTLKLPTVSHCYWSVQAVDGAFAGSPFAAESTVGVPDSPDTLAAFALGTWQPNPFSTSTRIGLDLSRAARVSVRVFDVSGRLVRRLAFERQLSAGRHHLEWDGRDERGDRVGSGAYLCSMEAEGFRSSRLIIRMR